MSLQFDRFIVSKAFWIEIELMLKSNNYSLLNKEYNYDPKAETALIYQGSIAICSVTSASSEGTKLNSSAGIDSGTV